MCEVKTTLGDMLNRPPEIIIYWVYFWVSVLWDGFDQAGITVYRWFAIEFVCIGEKLE